MLDFSLIPFGAVLPVALLTGEEGVLINPSQSPPPPLR